jgi:prenyltransferase beta subunit
MKRSGSMNICALLLASIMISVLLAPTVFALDTDYPLNSSEESIIKALNYLQKCQNEDGGFGNKPGENSSLMVTNWAVMAIESAEENSHEWKNNTKTPIDYMKEHPDELQKELNVAAAHERFILAIVASGEDPRNFNGINYVEKLKEFYNSTNNQIVDENYPTHINDEFWGILALASCNESGPWVENLTSFIKNSQNAGGGWGLVPNSAWSLADQTAAAIQALIAVGEDPKSKEIQNALNYLKENQNEDGGFSEIAGFESNAESDSWCIQAIVAAGEDPTDINWSKDSKNPAKYLLNLQQKDGSFNHTATTSPTPCWTTSYAISSLLGKPYPIFSAKAKEVTVKVRIEGKNATIWEGKVTFSNSTIVDTNEVEHYIPYPSALGALDEAAKKGGFNYTVMSSDGLLYVSFIESESGWLYSVGNITYCFGAGPGPWGVSANKFELNTTSPPEPPHTEVLYYNWMLGYKLLRISLSKTTVIAGEPFTVTVESFNSSTISWNPVENATVYVNSLNYITNENGDVTVSIEKAGHYIIYAEKEDYIRSEKKTIKVSRNIFDTKQSANPYPSIFGTHNGTIKPSHVVFVQKMYTYPCPGTGGHSEKVIFYNSTTREEIANGTWKGYAVGDYHYIEFEKVFILKTNVTYNYTIRTGSYPRIHHNGTLITDDGIITCAEFIDVNGRTYKNWIPAIRLEG